MPTSRAGKRLRVPLSVLLAAALLWGCGGDDGPSGPTDSFDRRAMLGNMGENLLVPTYQQFASDAAALGQAVDAYCASLGTGDESGARAAAQSAWTEAIASWQIAEAMLFGPAAMNEKTLREHVYSWPLTSSCAVDQEVAGYHADPGSVDVTTKLNNRRGLDALEYLLFAESLDHTCPVQTAPEGWNQLADADRRRARCGYAALAAADVSAQANVVIDAWSPEGGNFLGELQSAGESGSSFSSAQEAVNVVSDALFYLDTEVKDMKLAQPAGITDNSCGTVQEPCLEELESVYAAVSKQHVAQNLLGIDRLFHGDALDGTEGLGFDDFLVELGAPEVATSLSEDIRAARSAVDAIPGSLREALEGSYSTVTVAHEETRTVTTTLKSQFLTVLGLDAPDSAAGDND